MRLAILFLIVAARIVNAAETFIDSGSAADSGFIGGTALTIANVPGLQDATTRYGTFRYSIPCAVGPYLITFSFVESAASAKGQRVFSIRINQATAFDKLDLFAVAGRNPITRTVFAYCSDGAFNVEFAPDPSATVYRSATVSALTFNPMTLTTTTYISSGQQTVRVTDAVPVWFSGEGAFFVPRPAIDPDPTVQFVYQNVEVYRNGVRLRNGNQSAGGAEFSVSSAVGQLKILPISGQPWPPTDTLIVDYTAVFPPPPLPTPPDPPN